MRFTILTTGNTHFVHKTNEMMTELQILHQTFCNTTEKNWKEHAETMTSDKIAKELQNIKPKEKILCKTWKKTERLWLVIPVTSWLGLQLERMMVWLQ